jgi:hypothetical protein
LNHAHPYWQQNVRDFVNERLVSVVSKYPEFDLKGFNAALGRLVSTLEHADSEFTRTLVMQLVDLFVQKCTRSVKPSIPVDAHSVSSTDSIRSFHPPPVVRKIWDLTSDSSVQNNPQFETSSPLVSTSIAIPMARPLDRDARVLRHHEPLSILLEQQAKRPKLKGFGPHEIRQFLDEVDAYQREFGVHAKDIYALLSPRELNILFASYGGLKHNSAVDDATLRPMLQNMIPTVARRDVIEYFNSKVAMKEKRKTDSYTRDEIYKYRERFLDFVQHFQSFWTTCEESPVKFQIDLFLNAIQPQDFRKKLTEGRSMLKTLQQV